MRSVLKKATFLVFGLSTLVVAPLASSAQELKIGFVNTERIFREATPAKVIKLTGTSVFGYLVNLTTVTPAAIAHTITLHTVIAN